MADTAYRAESGERRTLGTGYVFGAPVRDLGIFATVLMGAATGMAAFFAATFVGIVTILFLNGAGHHVDYSMSYLRVGLPVGSLVMFTALTYLGIFWVKRVFRRA